MKIKQKILLFFKLLTYKLNHQSFLAFFSSIIIITHSLNIYIAVKIKLNHERERANKKKMKYCFASEKRE
jgi:hypothetical protein